MIMYLCKFHFNYPPNIHGHIKVRSSNKICMRHNHNIIMKTSIIFLIRHSTFIMITRHYIASHRELLQKKNEILKNYPSSHFHANICWLRLVKIIYTLNTLNIHEI